ncbi:MAG: glycosyltransferase [Bacteroidia bacterium]|nr:glycosyltransferase [Bacteroidia bacterium]
MHIGVLSDPSHFHTQKWVKGLREAGARVTVFSFSPYRLPDVPCVQIVPRYTWRGRITYASYLFSGDRLARALRAAAIDVLNPINVTPYGVWAAGSGFRPVASIAMGADILEYPPPRYAASRVTRTWESRGARGPIQYLLDTGKRVCFRQAVKWALHKADLVTGDNRVLTEAVTAWFGIPPERVKLNRWGVEPELFVPRPDRIAWLREKLQLPEGSLVVLSPRGLKPVYQADIILDAFERLLPDLPAHVILVALTAGYTPAPALAAQARRMEATWSNFRVVWEVLDRTDMCQLWNLTQVMINIPAYDGYSNALSEARYLGVIPVVNRIPAHEEIVVHEETAWITDPADADTLAEDLHRIILNPTRFQTRYHPANEAWIRHEALLRQNAHRFVEDCKSL